MKTYLPHQWVADRVNRYGWSLRGIAGDKWCYHGKGLQYVVIGVVERRVGGRLLTLVEKRWVDVFDECIRENFGESIYDGREKEITLDD